MKELSIEEKAKRYDKAIERARKILKRGYYISGDIESMFSELKESEDEKIRKELISFLQLPHPKFVGERKQEKWLTWLEKQGEKPNNVYDKELSEILGRIIRRYINDPNIPYIEREKVSKEIIPYVEWLEKQGEQTPNKIEPKFKVRDWITDNTSTFQIVKVENEWYYADDGDKICFDVAHQYYHLWTINDAKDGDVLIDKSNGEECPFIFKETKPSNIKTDVLNPLSVLGYCGIGGAGFTKGSGWGDTANCIYYPATEEQRQQLEKAMTDAGYTFDFEKKELKEIEDKHTWSEEDERHLSGLIGLIEDVAHDNVRNFRIISDNEKDDIEHWLKSLKERYTWKPSDNELEVLRLVAEKDGTCLIGLYEQLKKLR